jgi:SpoVK/Ycf46/Vps4 family AAA+-type ATPase
MSWGSGFCFWQTFRSDDLSENVLRHLVPHDLRPDVEGDVDFAEMLPSYRNFVVALRMALQAIRDGQSDQAIAQAHFISKCFERGVGTSPNYEMALGWQRVACDLGDLDASIRIVDTLRICIEDTSGNFNEITKTEMIGFSLATTKNTLKIWLEEIESQKDKINRTEVNNVAVLVEMLSETHKLVEARGDEAWTEIAGDALSSALRAMLDLGCIEKIDLPLRKKIEALASSLTSTGQTIIVCREKFVKAKDFDPRPFLVLNKPIALTECRDIDEIKSGLLARFPWAYAAIDFITGAMELRSKFGNQVFHLPPLLLVGPPGSGKTSLASHLGKLARVPATIYPVGGSSDNRALQGTARGWSSGQPSLIVQSIARKKIANPIFILDELDKVSERGHNGSVWDTLHLLSERATSARFFDDYLYSECDLSHVNYIATSNSLGRIPESLLSRFRIVLVPTPTREDAPAILNSLRESFAHSIGIDERFLPHLDDDEFEMLSRLVGQSLRMARRFFDDTIAARIETEACGTTNH